MDDLIAAAIEARKRAYAPYSRYTVGAAARSADGRIWTGANVENVSYGLTLCAERVAIATMVAAGERRLADVVVATKDGAMPCGMCLQTMLEFAQKPEELRVVMADEAGSRTEFTLAALLPHGFRSKL